MVDRFVAMIDDSGGSRHERRRGQRQSRLTVVAMAAAVDCGQWLVGGNNDGGNIGGEEEGGRVVGVNNRVNVLVGYGERE